MSLRLPQTIWFCTYKRSRCLVMDCLTSIKFPAHFHYRRTSFIPSGYLLCLLMLIGFYYQSDMSAGETESLAISAEGATAPETLRQKDR